jgi:hypothetical protein
MKRHKKYSRHYKDLYAKWVWSLKKLNGSVVLHWKLPYSGRHALLIVLTRLKSLTIFKMFRGDRKTAQEMFEFAKGRSKRQRILSLNPLVCYEAARRGTLDLILQYLYTHTLLLLFLMLSKCRRFDTLNETYFNLGNTFQVIIKNLFWMTWCWLQLR